MSTYGIQKPNSRTPATQQQQQYSPPHHRIPQTPNPQPPPLLPHHTNNKVQRHIIPPHRPRLQRHHRIRPLPPSNHPPRRKRHQHPRPNRWSPLYIHEWLPEREYKLRGGVPRCGVSVGGAEDFFETGRGEPGAVVVECYLEVAGAGDGEVPVVGGEGARMGMVLVGLQRGILGMRVKGGGRRQLTYFGFGFEMLSDAGLFGDTVALSRFKRSYWIRIGGLGATTSGEATTKRSLSPICSSNSSSSKTSKRK